MLETKISQTEKAIKEIKEEILREDPFSLTFWSSSFFLTCNIHLIKRFSGLWSRLLFNNQITNLFFILSYVSVYLPASIYAYQ